MIEETSLSGVLIVTPKRFGDNRGFFCETYNRDHLLEFGVDTVFVQDNQSISQTPGTIRGLHFQAPPRAQTKLVRCGRGRLFDVVVDLRVGSPTYGKWTGVELSSENGRQLLIPVGFAHGFATREPGTEIIYKCSDTYAPETEGVVRYDDPDIGIDWGLGGTEPTLSAKDRAAPLLRDIPSPFRFRE